MEDVSKMQAAVMTERKKMSIVKRDIPVPKANEVLVKIDYCGICGSDLHYYEIGHLGDTYVTFPYVLGHEAAGTVVRTGEMVTGLNIGDRVAIEPGIPCGKCELCRSGHYNICPELTFLSNPPVDGMFCEYVAHPADYCHKLPDSVSTLEGALIEPLAVGFHAARQGGASLGQTAVIAGAGCIGLMLLKVLQAIGVSPIYITDIVDKRLEKARQFGAVAINSSVCDPIETVLTSTEGRGVDLFFETAGTEKTTRQGVDMVRRGGTMVLLGYTKSGEVLFPMSKALDKEIQIKTNFRYRNVYPVAISAVASGTVNIKEIVTNVFDFSDIERGMNQSLGDKANIVKAVIKM